MQGTPHNHPPIIINILFVNKVITFSHPQIASDTLGWDKKETRLPLEGKLQYGGVTSTATAAYDTAAAGAGAGACASPVPASAAAIADCKLSPVVAVLAVHVSVPKRGTNVIITNAIIANDI